MVNEWEAKASLPDHTAWRNSFTSRALSVLLTLLSYVTVLFMKYFLEEVAKSGSFPSSMRVMWQSTRVPFSLRIKPSPSSTASSLPAPSSKEGEILPLLEMPKEGNGMQDVGGMEETKRLLRECAVLPLTHPSILFGPQTPNGVLLHGPPGTGKTLLARSLAGECRVPLLPLSASSLESKWWGESEKLLSAAFTLARRRAPCILFIDEIDGMGRERSGADSSHVYTFKCELLRNMDTIKGEPVLVLACTNCPSSLDPALSRRFQRVVKVCRPDAEGRVDILRKIMEREGEVVHPSLLSFLSSRTEGKTGADLHTLFQKACSVRGRERDVEEGIRKGLIHSREDVKKYMGPLKRKHWSAAMSEERE